MTSNLKRYCIGGQAFFFIEDLAVTRFYTTKPIYEVMFKIHEFDSALREAFEKGGQDKGVVFIQKDTKNRIIPCSPNKLLLSRITTLKPHKRLLPVGFQTGYKTYITEKINQIEHTVDQLVNSDNPQLINLEEAVGIINNIKETFDSNSGKIYYE